MSNKHIKKKPQHITAEDFSHENLSKLVSEEYNSELPSKDTSQDDPSSTEDTQETENPVQDKVTTVREESDDDISFDIDEAVSEKEEVTNSDSTNWEKRYSDLKSYSDKQKNEFTSKIKELEDKINSFEKSKESGITPSMTKEQIEETLTKYPHVFAAVKEIVKSELSHSVEKDIKELKSKREEELKKERNRAILKEHPDASKITQSDNFKDWFSKQTPTVKSLFKSLDAKEVVKGLHIYKIEAGTTPTKKEQEKAKDSVSVVPSVKSSLGDTPSAKYLFKESQIQQLKVQKPREYQNKLNQILQAYQKGQVLMDLSS